MNVYDKHKSTFALVTAGALVVNGKQVGTIAFKFPKDGAGRLSCYLHLHGHQMVIGTSSGYGYDKSAAAFQKACTLLSAECLAEFPALSQIGHLCDGLDFKAALRVSGIEYFKGV